jgi:predicted dehydrogenase
MSHSKDQQPQELQSNRRDFLKTSALVGATAFVVGRGAWADELNATPSKSPNERAAIACIGVGGKGDSDSKHCGQLADVVAICDIDDNHLDRKQKEFPKAKRYNDYRKMFDEMHKSIDGVTVSIPDHNHAIASMLAINLKKNVYCQKPLTHLVSEARRVREEAAKAGVVTQMGNQGTATSGLRRGVEILRAQALGPVKEVHVWTNRPIWPQAPKVVSRPPESPVPPNVHWDDWIGPAPMRPYAKYENGQGAYHTFNWRGWWDFGTGALGDMGCHTCNMPFMGLNLGYPTSIEGKCGDLNDETYPSWAQIVYEFPERGNMPALKFHWWEGHKQNSRDAAKRNLPPVAQTMGFTVPDSGAMIVGEKATMFSLSDYGEDLRIVFNGEKGDFSMPDVPQTLPRHKDHNQDLNQKREWIAAFRGGPKPMSNFDYAGMLAEFILLGNVAIRMQGEKLEWDGPGMKFTNNEKANKHLVKEYREGWKLS